MPLRLDLDGEEPGDSRVQRRYGINVLVSHETQEGAPVMIEERPSHGRLLGKIEHRARFGALSTDFTLIRAGALRQANGGYLVINALRLLAEPFAWDALKETLRSGTIRIVPPEQAYGFAATVSLEPVPIPVKLKVVLIGAPRLYYMLCELDPEFDDFFKVVAEFDDRTARNDTAQVEFAHSAVQAAFSFANSAVALPLLRDQPTADAISAMIISFQVMRRNPRPLLLWALLIVAAITAGFVTWFVGLVVTVPLIGHATWHAYRDTLDFNVKAAP